jgi:hypothetical protein
MSFLIDYVVYTACTRLLHDVLIPDHQLLSKISFNSKFGLTWLVMCRLGSAWKPSAKLGFYRPRPSKTKAWAVEAGLGQLRLGLGLGRGLWEKNHVMSHPSNKCHEWRDQPHNRVTDDDEWPPLPHTTSNELYVFFFISFYFFANHITLLRLGKDDIPVTVTNTLDDRRTSRQHLAIQDEWRAAGPRARRLTCPEPLVCVFFYFFLFFH